MASKSFILISMGMMFLCSSIMCPVSGQDCATNVQDCVTVAFDVFTYHGDDIPRVCKATNDFLQCLVRETRSCDDVVASSIKDSMSPMVDMYTNEPYNCDLESSIKEALKPDPCSQEMSQCSIYFLQAETEALGEYNAACRLFNSYLHCMKSNVSSCGQDKLSYIESHTANTSQVFNSGPLYCAERLVYPLDQVVADMTTCSMILNNMNVVHAKQDYVCSKYQDFFNCSVLTLMSASPRQFETYSQQINAISESLQVRPYFCDSENPCMALFKDCNQSAYNANMPPCAFMDVYSSCLSTSHQYCGEAEYITLATNTQIMIGELHNKYNCIEENMDKHFDETTPMAEVIDNGNDNNNNNEENDDTMGNDNANTPTDEMQNDGPVHNTDVPTPEPEHEPKATKSTDTTSGQNSAVPESGSKPEEKPTDNVVEVEEDEGMTATEKSQGGNGSSGSKSNNNIGDDDSSGSALKGSFWMLMLPLCLLVIKTRI